MLDFIPEQIAVKAEESLFLTCGCCHATVCVQMAAIGDHYLASVTRCKTSMAVVKPFVPKGWTFIFWLFWLIEHNTVVNLAQ